MKNAPHVRLKGLQNLQQFITNSIKQPKKGNPWITRNCQLPVDAKDKAFKL